MELRCASISLIFCICFFSFLSFLSAARLGLGHFGRCPIRRIHCRQISINTLLDLLHACLQLALNKIAVAVIDGFEFAAVDGDDQLRKEIEVAAKNCKLAAYAANGFAVVFAKVGNGFEVWSQTLRQLACNKTEMTLAKSLIGKIDKTCR